MIRRVKIGGKNQVDIGGQLVEISGHAVSTYRERFSSSLPYHAARQELESRLSVGASIQTERPRWLRGYTNVADSYVVLDEDLVLPLRKHRSDPGVLVAPTCLYKA